MLLFLPLLIGGGIGGIFTAPAIPGWYAELAKPAWNPPEWLFAPVWTALYLAMGAALVLIVRSASARSLRLGLSLFAIQLALNLGWSVAFFGLREIGWGLAVIVVLWLSIVATMLYFQRLNRGAAALLLPYLAWVSFATKLNLEIWRLSVGLA